MESKSNPPKSPKTHKKKRPKITKLSGKIDTLIQVIDEEQTKTPPIVGYFPSGVDPINKNQSNNDEIIVKTMRNQKKPRRIELVVKPNCSRVNYVGTNYSGEAAAGRLGVYRLAFVDKSSGIIKFIPIVSGKVFRLEPKVSKSDKSGEEPATPVKTELTNAEMKEKLGNLTAQYGTSAAVKKARVAQQLIELNDPESQQELNQVLELTKANKKAIESAKNTNRNIPPHDVSATTPADAYPVNKIISTGELDYVNDILHLLQAGEELKPDVYPTFVCNRSHKVVLLKDEEEKRKVAGVLSYITHLVNFKNKHSLDGVASSKHHKIPSMLLQKFTKMFLNTQKMKIADDKVEALLSYVLVLTLHIDEFESDFTDIAKDLKMSALSLRPYLENLGCKFRVRNRVTMATLPVPLTFPTARRKRRRG